MPIAALLPAIIGAGGAVGAAALSRKGSGGPSSSTPLLPPGLDTNALNAAIGKQQSLAGDLTSLGKDLMGQGRGILSGPTNFWQGILGGDRQQIMQSLAPEIAAVNAQYRVPLQEQRLLGKGSSLLPDLEAGKQSSISNLIFGARPQAADKLTSIAQGLMNESDVATGQAGELDTAAASEILNYNAVVRNLQMQAAQNSSQLFGSLGSSLANILSKILTPGGKSPAGTAGSSVGSVLGGVLGGASSGGINTSSETDPSAGGGMGDLGSALAMYLPQLLNQDNVSLPLPGPVFGNA